MFELRWKRLWNGNERADHGGVPWVKDDESNYILQYRAKDDMGDWGLWQDVPYDRDE